MYAVVKSLLNNILVYFLEDFSCLSSKQPRRGWGKNSNISWHTEHTHGAVSLRKKPYYAHLSLVCRLARAIPHYSHTILRALPGGGGYAMLCLYSTKYEYRGRGEGKRGRGQYKTGTECDSPAKWDNKNKCGNSPVVLVRTYVYESVLYCTQNFDCRKKTGLFKNQFGHMALVLVCLTVAYKILYSTL